MPAVPSHPSIGARSAAALPRLLGWIIPALLVAGILAAATTEAPATAAERPAKILLVGDSLAWEAVDHFRFFAEGSGHQLQVATFGGTAICDFLDDVVDLTATFRPNVIVAAFTGNALTPCMRGVDDRPLHGLAYGEKYRQDIAAMTAAAAGASIIWVGPPAPAGDPANFETLSALYARAVADWPNAVFVDGGAHISPNRRWVRTLPCLPFEPCTGPTVDGVGHNVVRAPDRTHLCPSIGDAPGGVVALCPEYSSGALRYALTMLDAARQHLRRTARSARP